MSYPNPPSPQQPKKSSNVAVVVLVVVLVIALLAGLSIVLAKFFANRTDDANRADNAASSAAAPAGANTLAKRLTVNAKYTSTQLDKDFGNWATPQPFGATAAVLVPGFNSLLTQPYMYTGGTLTPLKLPVDRAVMPRSYVKLDNKIAVSGTGYIDEDGTLTPFDNDTTFVLGARKGTLITYTPNDAGTTMINEVAASPVDADVPDYFATAFANGQISYDGKSATLPGIIGGFNDHQQCSLDGSTIHCFDFESGTVTQTATDFTARDDSFFTRVFPLEDGFVIGEDLSSTLAYTLVDPDGTTTPVELQFADQQYYPFLEPYLGIAPQAATDAMAPHPATGLTTKVVANAAEFRCRHVYITGSIIQCDIGSDVLIYRDGRFTFNEIGDTLMVIAVEGDRAITAKMGADEHKNHTYDQVVITDKALSREYARFDIPNHATIGFGDGRLMGLTGSPFDYYSNGNIKAPTKIQPSVLYEFGTDEGEPVTYVDNK